MERDDVNRRCVVFDRPVGNGLLGTIIAVYDNFTFRFKTDSGREYEFSTKTGEVKVQFLEES